jgi:hypothetical protein
MIQVQWANMRQNFFIWTEKSFFTARLTISAGLTK